jgi:hypothetical protein
MEKRVRGNGSVSEARTQAKVPRMQLEEYQRVPEDFWRKVGSNQEQMNKGKGETPSNPLLYKNPYDPDDRIGRGSLTTMWSRPGALTQGTWTEN